MPTVGDVLLDIRNVRLSLGGSLILDSVSFDIKDRIREGTCTGQVVSLLGPSGVGKTRLIRIIAGLDSPDDGTVHGHNKARLEPGSVGVVFQEYPLLWHRTVRKNLEIAASISGLDATSANKRTSELLEQFGLAERASLYPAQLSGGQRQRAAIAQQLVLPRKLLIMDEPFSGLDPAALTDVMKLIVQVANLDELNTILIVTHDVKAALAVSDTLFMLGRKWEGEKRIPGAKIVESYDLVERGLAWEIDVEQRPAFLELEREIRARFRKL